MIMKHNHSVGAKGEEKVCICCLQEGSGKRSFVCKVINSLTGETRALQVTSNVQSTNWLTFYQPEEVTAEFSKEFSTCVVELGDQISALLYCN